MLFHWSLLRSPGLLFVSFSHSAELVVFLGSLSDSRSSQGTRTFLSILADLNNAIVWVFLILALIFNSFNPLNKPLMTVPSAPATIGITVTFMFHRFFGGFFCSLFCFLGFFYVFVLGFFFFCSLARSKYLSMFSFSFIILLLSTRM